MKTMPLLVLASAALASTLAFAQTKPQPQAQSTTAQSGTRMQHRGGGMMALDTDKDGRISRAEAEAGKGELGKRFDQLDVNKDGYLDKADREARMQQRRGECFDKADADKNGQLSRAEFDKMHEVCGMGMHQKGDGQMMQMRHRQHRPMPMATPAAAPNAK